MTGEVLVLAVGRRASKHKEVRFFTAAAVSDAQRALTAHRTRDGVRHYYERSSQARAARYDAPMITPSARRVLLTQSLLKTLRRSTRILVLND